MKETDLLTQATEALKQAGDRIDRLKAENDRFRRALRLIVGGAAVAMPAGSLADVAAAALAGDRGVTP